MRHAILRSCRVPASELRGFRETLIQGLAPNFVVETSQASDRPLRTRLSMAPILKNRSIVAKDRCATRKTHRRTLTYRCSLRKNKEEALDSVRKARALQSDLRGDVRGGGREGVLENLGTKRSRWNGTALSTRKASHVLGKRMDEDQRQVGTENIKNGGVAEGAEESLAVASWRNLRRGPESVCVVEKNVSRRVTASLDFCKE